LKIYPEDAVKVFIGDLNFSEYRQLTPFNCLYEKNAAQTIYYEEEIGTTGIINALEYYYSAQPGESVQGKPVRIYMAVTHEDDLYEGWITQDTVLVYDGFINLPDNRRHVLIPLQKPFMYTGGNLLIYTVSSDTKSYYAFTQFRCTTGDRFRSRVMADHVIPFDFTQTGRILKTTADISLIMNKKGASLSGTITDNNRNPIAGAVVEIAGESWKTTTDADGRYQFVFIPENTTCEVIASKPGYTREVQSGVMRETDLVFDMILTACEARPVENLSIALVSSELNNLKYAHLSWEQPDNREGGTATGYRIYANRELKAKLSADAFTYLDLISPGEYIYEVSAVWDSGCESRALSETIELLPDTVIVQYPFFESFESGQIPAFWEGKRLQNDLDWEVVSEVFDEEKTFTAHSGQYFVTLCDMKFYSTITRLTTPILDFSALPEPYLSFWHIQALWGAMDRDILALYYKNTPEGKWKKLAEYDMDIESWKKEIIPLPEPSATYRIAFEGISIYGYGVMLDDIKVSDIDGTNAIPFVEKGKAAPAEIFPNPVSTTLTVKGESIKQVEIYGILGQPVETVSFHGEKQMNLDVKNYEAGIYLVKVSDLNGESITRRIIVSHK
jgi:hypothetical protein